MNSFYTRDDSLALLERYPSSRRRAADFVQHKEPKLLVDGLTPAEWPPDPSLEWCPPGHGDLYPALLTSGMLDALLERGYRYAFMSNSDNLGAVLDPRILAWFAAEGLPYLCEVTDRTEADKKGGHIARLKETGGLILRETAQTPTRTWTPSPTSSATRTSTSTTCGSTCARSTRLLRERDGVLGLPMIVNEKTVDPSDSSSPAVYQLETAMGAAIGVFEGARAIRVPRSRFVPVKKTSDLLVLRSDAYVLGDGARIELARAATAAPLVDLDDEHFEAAARLRRAVPGRPAVAGAAERLAVRGRRHVRARRRGAGRDVVEGPRGRGRRPALVDGLRPRSARRAAPSSSDSPSIRTNSQASAIPITIDCSSAMIRPATCWSSSGGHAPSASRPVVGVVEQLGGEREHDPEEADEDLRRAPCRPPGPSRRAAGASGSARAGATSTGARRRRSSGARACGPTLCSSAAS